MTSEPLSSGGEGLFDPAWMSSPEDSRASPSPLPAGSERRKTNGGFGRQSPKSFASYDPDGCCWRTFQVCLGGDLETFSGTWPRAGMTRSGTAFRLRPSAPITDVTGSSWLPTPRATDGDRGGRGDLLAMVRTGRTSRRREWPTPTASRADRWGMPSRQTAARRYWVEGRRNLDDAVALWPTPTVQDSTGRGYQKQGDTGRALTLVGAARVSSGGEYDRAGSGHLNPVWVEWLMGFPPGWTDLEPSGTP